MEDEGGFISTTTLQIDVSDANDQGPNFVFDVYDFKVAENSPGNSQKWKIYCWTELTGWQLGYF